MGGFGSTDLGDVFSTIFNTDSLKDADLIQYMNNREEVTT